MLTVDVTGRRRHWQQFLTMAFGFILAGSSLAFMPWQHDLRHCPAIRLPDAVLLQLFRAPYGAGYWTNEKQADEITKCLWKEVRKHHVHIMW